MGMVYVWLGEKAPADSLGSASLAYGKLWSSTMCQWSTLNLEYAMASRTVRSVLMGK